MENRQARTLQNSENFVLSQNGVRKYFLAKLFVPLIKRNISKRLRLSKIQFSKNSLKCCRNHSSKETFLQHLREFWKIEFLTENRQARTLQNSENFVLSQNGVRKYFFGKIICSTHQKKHFYNIWGCQKFNFPKTASNVVETTHQKKHFYNIWGSFWKIEFLTENRQAGTLQNSENFVLSQNGVRNIFWQNYLFHSSKETFQQHLRQFLENWIFDRKLTGADLTK